MRKKDHILDIFLGTGTVLSVIVIIALLFNPDIVNAYLFANPLDSFMDYFNSINIKSFQTSYSGSAIYPPLCNAIFYLLRVYSGNIDMAETSEFGAGVLRNYTAPMMVFTISSLASVLVIIHLLTRYLNQKDLKNQWTVALIVFSVPVLFLIQRGNIMILSLIGVMVFFLLKDSSDSKLRNAGYFCLAIASSIKLYPAIFGLILIKDKEYKEALKLSLWGVGVFIITFILFCTEGLGGIPLFFGNITGFNSSFFYNTVQKTTIDAIANISGNTAYQDKPVFDSYVIDGCRIGYAAFLEHLFMWFGNSLSSSAVLASKMAIVISVVGTVASFFSKRRWQTVALLAAVLVGAQNRSYVYTAVFMIIPLVMFLNDEDKGNLKYLYLVLQILIFFPLPFGWDEHIHEPMYYVNHRSFNSLQIGGAILLMTLVMVFEVIVIWIKEKRKRQK